MQHNNDSSDPDIPTSTISRLPTLDLPAESTALQKTHRILTGSDQQNAFLSRNESINSMNSNHHNNLNSNPSSQRYNINQITLKSKHVIGLPQKTSYVDSKRRPANVRLFPANKKNSPTVTVAVTEPSSPKVSCIGRVRSKRCRSYKKSKRENGNGGSERSERCGKGQGLGDMMRFASGRSGEFWGDVGE
ncbi:hypothetical protein Tco_1046542 [Tanacetum coccineum]